MRRRVYPKCEGCDGEINPHKYDDCQKYYISNGLILCKECFKKEAEEYIESNLDDFAALVGAGVVELL